MSESEFIFHLFYILFVASMLYPPSEFVSAGLTINNLFSRYFGDEILQFIQYHVKRTSVTIIFHSLLPLGYVTLYYYYYWNDNVFDSALKRIMWNLVVLGAGLLPLMSGTVIWTWSKNNWENHPICRRLKKFANNNSPWEAIAIDINTEYRRDDKLLIKTNPIFTVVATENWILKITPYTVHLAHQSDTALIADKSDSHVLGPGTSEAIQFVNIQVRPTRNGIKDFTIRINALDFRDLQDRLIRPITILSNVQFHQTVIDRWIQVFKDQIGRNPSYPIPASHITDSCFACMAIEPNIKLQKHCSTIGLNGEVIPEQERCGNCYCRPMWCVECMAKWFASRQNQFEREIWLQQKCTCPMCRAPFCILDICYVEKIDDL